MLTGCVSSPGGCSPVTLERGGRREAWKSKGGRVDKIGVVVRLGIVL